MLTILIGKSAVGKDTLLKKMVADNIARPVVSYTTRPKRSGESDGVDYHFVSFEDFQTLLKEKKLAEYRFYNTKVGGVDDVWYYGTPYVDARKKNYVVIQDISGAVASIETYGSDNVQVIYLTASDEVRKERAIKRGSFDEIEWNRRLADDNKKFSEDQLKRIKTTIIRRECI